MKETINVNIGTLAFTLDEDAYRTLKAYFDDIRCRLPENDQETMDDIERRTAEILREKISSPMRVVTLDTVHFVMSRMGSPAEFGDRRADFAAERPAVAPGARQLRRSIADRSIAGICGGIAEFGGFNSTLVRIATLLLIVLGGISLWIYVILWIVIPEDQRPAFEIKDKKR